MEKREIGLLLYLAAAAFGDVKNRSVSPGLAVVFGAVAVALSLLMGNGGWMSLLAGILPGLLMLGVSLGTRESVGYGDGIAVMVCGLYLGFWGSLEILMMGLFLTFPLSLFLVVFKKAGRKGTIPFIPFLLGGFLLWLCCGG